MAAYPFLIPLAAALAGISTAGIFRFFLPDNVLLPLALLTLLGLLSRRRLLFTLPLAFLLFAWGDLSLAPLLAPLPTAVRLPGPERGKVTVEGIVSARPDGRAEGERLLVIPERIAEAEPLTSGKILVTVREGRTVLCTGDRIRFETTLREPRNYGLPGEFDRVRHLALQGVTALGSVAAADEIEVVGRGARFPIQGRLDLLALRLSRFIVQQVPGENGAILTALLLGDRGGISRATEDAFARAGVNHILSISGFHVAIVGLCLYQLLFAAARRSEYLALRVDLRRFVPLAVIPCAVFYLFLSGAAAATVRSVLMIVLGTAVLLTERETDPQNTLMVAAAVMLGAAPAVAFDISFQLSFLAVWGLVALTPLIIPGGSTGWKGKILLTVAASVAATVATAVPVAFHFHRVSLAGIAANLVIIPLMGYGAVVTGFAALPLVPLFPAAASLLLRTAGLLVGLSVKAVAFFSSLPALPPWYPTRLDMLLFLCGVAAVTLCRSRKGRGVWCGMTALALILVRVPLSSGESDHRLRVDFLSVGQAEATLVRFPDGKTMLVDGGGNFAESGFDVGERLVGPALRSLGVERLDRIVLSHPHPDHLGGLPFVVGAFPVGEVVMSRLSAASPAVGPLLDLVRRRGIPLRLVDESTPVHEFGGGATIAMLAPPAPGRPGLENDDNEDSLVFRLTYGGVSLLFTGDIGPFTETRLARSGVPLKATVLKVPHHGSRFSSTDLFLSRVSPKVAVISAGAGNRFGLPAAEAVERLRRHRAQVWRTDQVGTVKLVSDGAEWQLDAPFAGRLSLNK